MAERERARVLIADDHPIVAHGMARIVSQANDLDVVATCYSGREVLEAVGRTPVDLLVLDFRMGDITGLDVCRRLRAVAPDARAVLLTAFDDVAILRRCLAAGARGVLLKATLDLDLVRVLRLVHAGRVVVDESVAAQIHAAQGALPNDNVGSPQLTRREIEVLKLMAKGQTLREIAEELGLSINTVRSYLQTLMEKLNAHTQVQAIVFALKQHLI